MTDTETPARDHGGEPFECPRCGATVQERFWGPCRECRSALVATYAPSDHDSSSDDAQLAPARFEPVMHVVPNHVATKD